MPATYSYVHQSAGSLESGRPLAFGDEVALESRELDLPHNRLLLAEGHLIAGPEPQPKRKSKVS